ncbi:MFS transporter [Methanocella sp. CWC-04]|uniref:MFS transporter n=1 Tax=Methanooceanicella nereidis TaxID=2052831 RepID=A0AAP2RCR7_9EURY|nr:MFS transporter [Methanocella sp. CWC-04]MCD1294938.1 MFS transporter [Methanocella sp. CWC-04]
MSSFAQKNVPDATYKNKYLILLIVLAGIFMSVLDGIVVSIALPTITSYFNVDVAISQWTITAYLLTMTSLLLIFGRVSEYTGKIKLFMIGFLVFILSSLACGLSSSIEQLIAFRVLQGIGGAMVFGISGAILFQAFPMNERGRAMGYLGATVAIGSIAGPILGGFIVDTLGWQYIFLINVPLGAVLLTAALKYLKMEETTSHRLNMDWIGALTLIVSMVSLITLLGELAKSVSITMSSTLCAGIFIVAFAAFMIRESKCTHPLLDLSIFKDKKFLMPMISMTLFFISNFMMSFIGPFYFQGVMKYSPSQVGMVYLIMPLVMMIGSPLSGWLYDKYRSKHLSALGMLIMSLSTLLLGYLCLAGDMMLIIVCFVLLGVGSAIFQSPNNTEMMNALPKSKIAIGSSASATLRNLGMTLGVSLSSIMVTLQLSMAGYDGAILEAGTPLLSGTIGNIMFMAGLLCAIGVVTSLLRNIDIKTADGTKKTAQEN